MRSRFEQFLRGVHRRMLVLRAAECAGIGAAMGAGICLLVSILLIAREQSPVFAGLIVLLIGGVVGLMWGVIRRPTMMGSAMRADVQLRLADLLGTAWAMRGSRDPWAGTVVAMAETAVRGRHPREVVLHRLGVRSWGGIVASLLLAGAMLVGYASPSTTSATTGDERFVTVDQIETMAKSPEFSPLPGWADQAEERALAQAARGGRQLEPARGASDAGEAGVEQADNAATVADAQGAGGGAGESESATIASLQIATGGDEIGEGEAEGGDIAAAGAGRPGGGGAGQRGAGGEANDSTMAGVGQNIPIEPWRSGDWQLKRQAALQSIDAHAADQRHRALIRAYFSTPEN